MTDWRTDAAQMDAEAALMEACEQRANALPREMCEAIIARARANGLEVFLCGCTGGEPTLEDLRGLVADILYLEDES